MREETAGILLLAAAQSAGEGVVEKELGGLNGGGAEVFVPQRGRPLGQVHREVSLVGVGMRLGGHRDRSCSPLPSHGRALYAGRAPATATGGDRVPYNGGM